MPVDYIGRNIAASPNLHAAAFSGPMAREIPSYMAGKHKNHIQAWRKRAGYTQKEVIDRLRELIAAGKVDPEERIPTTEASLSRMENGEQNFAIAALEALAIVLGVDEPGWLLDTDPTEGKPVNMWGYNLDKDEAELARQVLEKMFGSRDVDD